MYEQAATARAVRTRTTGVQWFAPYALAAMLVGLLLAIVGAIVLLRGDYTDGMTSDHFDVAGLSHTPLLGLIELAVGVILIIAGAARSRSATMALGVLLLAFGVVLVAQSDSLHDDLGVTAAHGWWCVVLGAVLFAVAALTPSVHRATTVDVRDVDGVVEAPIPGHLP